MRKVIKGMLVFMVVFLFPLLTGCQEIEVPPASDDNTSTEKLLYQKTISIDEDYYAPVGPIDGIDDLKIVVSVTKCPSSGFEVWIMTSSQFLDFYYNDIVEVVEHFTVYEGVRTLTVTGLDPNEVYFVVFDNTNYGWTHPPTNFENDYVTLSYEIYTTE